MIKSCAAFFTPHIMHPSRATHNQCTGFTKNHRHCRLEAVEGQKTCRIHRNYYTGWLYSHPRIDNLSTDREAAEFDFQVRNRHVTITEEYCKRIIGHNISFYEYLIKNAGINPLWNEEKLLEVFYNIVTKFQHQSADWEKDVQRLNEILTTPEVCKYIFRKILELGKQWIHDGGDTTEYIMNSCRLLFLLGFQMPSGWRQMISSTFFMEEVKAEIKKVNGIREEKIKQDLLNYLEHIVKPEISYFMTIAKKNVKENTNVFKEELMIEMWKPSRVQKWFDDGGEKLYEMMAE